MLETLERLAAESAATESTREDRARWLRITYYGSITGELATGTLGGVAVGLLINSLFAGGDTEAYAVVSVAGAVSTYLCDSMRRTCKRDLTRDLLQS